MSLTENKLYNFDDFVLDSSKRILLQNGKIVSLSPKVFDTLLVLVEEAGDVVKKEDLMKAVWSDTIAGTNNLDQNMFLLRKALRDSSTKQKYIKTIPKVGYQFIAPIEVLPASGNNSTTAASKESEILQSNLELEKNQDFLQSDETHKDFTKPVAQAKDTAAIVENKEVKDKTFSFKFVSKKIKQNKIAALLILAVMLFGVTVGVFVLYRIVEQARSNAAFQKMKMTRLTTDGKAVAAAISPDGKYAAFVRVENGQQSLWIRQVAVEATTQLVQPSDGLYNGITFSADGNYILYVLVKSAAGELYKVPTLGGMPKKIIENINSGVSVSPDNDKIAFIRTDRQAGEHFLMIANTDGSEERYLISRKNPENFPAPPSWSPDGKLIAYVTSKVPDTIVNTATVEDGIEKPLNSQTWDIVYKLSWLADASGLVVAARERGSFGALPQLWHLSCPGGEAKKITNDLDFYSDLSLTADSKALVTIQRRETARVWVVPGGDTASAKPITASEEFVRYGLDWLPDGRIIYPSIRGNYANFIITDTNGSNRQKLTEEASAFWGSVSPDGQRIAFASDRSGKLSIWTMNIDGSNPKRLTDGNLPSYSPDGKWIAYAFWESSGPRVWKVPAEGGEPVQLLDKFSNFPAFSPDGKLIICLYRENGIHSPAKIAVISTEDGTIVKKFDALPPTLNPTRLKWMPQGDAIACIDTREGVSNIWKLSLDGREPEQVTNFTSELIYYFDWSNDGTQLAVVRGTESSNMVLISDFK